MEKNTSGKIRIGVLYGGISNEKEVSLRSGKNVMKNLSSEKYDVSGLFIEKETLWRAEGFDGETRILDTTTEEAKEFLRGFDILFNALHGAFGEDGRLQGFLDTLGVPYTGSGERASFVAMDKALAMESVRKNGIVVPDFFLVTKKDSLSIVKEKITEYFGYPVIVKPNGSGSTLGLSLVREEGEVATALEKSFAETKEVLVQKYIAGREFTCGVLGNHQAEKIMVLPPVEIIVPPRHIFGYEEKYLSQETLEICPAEIDQGLLEKIQSAALEAHRILGCDGLSRSDFRLDEAGQIFYLETNTSPGMTEASLCPKEALAFGMTMPQFLDTLVQLSFEK
ncbi:MAG: D-alanine--D-alanine ligase [Candidatus Moranbacteria bacterium]|nr:D-alanine--D-alanine ligase [Candidatus Moranbacteria bacterium]